MDKERCDIPIDLMDEPYAYILISIICIVPFLHYLCVDFFVVYCCCCFFLGKCDRSLSQESSSFDIYLCV
jgi:hypothetical protein